VEGRIRKLHDKILQLEVDAYSCPVLKDHESILMPSLNSALIKSELPRKISRRDDSCLLWW